MITFWYHLTASQGAVLDWFQFSLLAQLHVAVSFKQQIFSDTINTAEVLCSTLLLGKTWNSRLIISHLLLACLSDKNSSEVTTVRKVSDLIWSSLGVRDITSPLQRLLRSHYSSTCCMCKRWCVMGLILSCACLLTAAPTRVWGLRQLGHRSNKLCCQQLCRHCMNMHHKMLYGSLRWATWARGGNPTRCFCS